MAWFRRFVEQSDAVSINVSNYAQSLKTLLEDLWDYSQSEKERLSAFRINPQTIAVQLQQLQYPEAPQLLSVLNSKNDDQIKQQSDKFTSWARNQKGFENYKRTFEVEKVLNDLRRSLRSDSNWSKEDLEKTFQNLVDGTTKNMQIIAQSIEQAIGRIPSWNGTTIIVEAGKVDKSHEYLQPLDGAYIQLGTGHSSPGFAYFSHEGKAEIDDVLDAGDEDFFASSQIRQDYFNLIQELRKPGSSVQSGKILKLYTARPAKDRQRYIDVQTIPSGIYLTDNPNSIEGLAVDLAGSGKRDIWKVRIDNKYLVMMLDTPREKHYQAVGSGEVPVKSIDLISTGE